MCSLRAYLARNIFLTQQILLAYMRCSQLRLLLTHVPPSATCHPLVLVALQVYVPLPHRQLPYTYGIERF